MADIRVISPSGRTGTIPEEDLESALSQGFRQETPEQSRDRQLESKYGDSPIKAGALGLARGASLGASDWILRETGAVSQEELTETTRRNQAASLAGEFGSFLLPGGALGAVAKAAKGAAGVIKGVGLTARVARGAVDGAIQGGFMGAGHAVSEAALDGDPVLNGEKLAAGALQGAIFGSAAGAVVGVASHGVRSLADHLNAKAAQKIQAADDKIKAMAEEEYAAQLQSAKGSYGGEAQKSNRMLQNFDLFENDPALSEETRRAIAEFKSGAQAQTLRETTSANLLRDAPEQAGRTLAKRAEYEAVREGRDEIVSDLIGKIDNPLHPVKRFANRYGAPAVGQAVGATIGGTLGGAPGAVLGGMLGQAALGYKRPMQHAFERVVKNPAVSKAFWKSIKNLTEKTPETLGVYAGPMTAAVARGPAAVATVHAVLTTTDPKYTETMVAAGFQDETPDQVADIERRSSQLNGIEATLAEQDRQTDMAIGRFLGTQPGATPKITKNTRPKSERLADLKVRVDRLAEAVTKPGALLSALNPGQTISEAAPATAAATSAAAARAVKFLQSQAPGNPAANPIRALESDWKPSDQELTRWERIVRAIEQPRSLLDDLRRGAINPDSVEAVQAVYPMLLQEWRDRMMNRLSAYDGKLGYTQKQALSILMGQQMGTAGDPGRLRILQDGHSASANAQGQKQRQTKISNQLATLGQKVEDR